jgi:hypothetical protein
MSRMLRGKSKVWKTIENLGEGDAGGVWKIKSTSKRAFGQCKYPDHTRSSAKYKKI